MKTKQEQGLSCFAIKAIGFKTKCQCGHEDGLHNADGECAVLNCECKNFHPYCKPDQSCCDFCCGN